jgi:hypothetical protein
MEDNENGELNLTNLKIGWMHEGKFYEEGSPELKKLLEIEGSKPENKDTLLGIIAEAAKE